MLTRRFFLNAGGAAVAATVELAEWRSRAPTPTAASSSSSSAAPPTGCRSSRPTGDPQHAGLRAGFDQDLADRSEARQLLHAPSSARRDRENVRGEAGAVRPRGRLALSRPFALRRAERARDRRVVGVPAEGRLAEPIARPPAAGGCEGAGDLRHRSDGASRQPSRSHPTRRRSCPDPSDDLLHTSLGALRSRSAASRLVERGGGDADDGRRRRGGGGQNGAAIGAIAAKMLSGERATASR